MRLGVLILPELPWAEAGALWRRAEDLGFDHAWTYDHVAWGVLRDEPWYGAVPTLAAAALSTTRIRLGTLVASPNFRHPVPFARELISLDDLSRGRLTLGIGAGGTGWDAGVLGQRPWPRAERAGRFAEFVELTDRLLAGSPTTYAGRYYAAERAPTTPGCVQRPRIPFAVAATGPRGMAVAAAHGQLWVTAGDPAHAGAALPAPAGAASVRAQMDLLDDACGAAGRDPASIGRLVLTGPRLDAGLTSVEAFRDAVGHYEAAGVTDLVVHWPRPQEPFAGDLATFERIFTA
ncbi:LLM class flavin-dependent oxidoreductase [Frankia sp. CNm7]|uniref:LLM class flavin-dependent oxidoreductase n=1 Tax=Frankia nepalensis TaxID=1836974 RepID=A0A937UPN2_9ACTN|nr:LLM class flavin-dependent oxidoreductase [Frankia nepalensis]MBL7501772.1 LLM class flavin-dependent oxidoreductase [Frankia nepalensis]MBL7515171.1 LLM class flavin-dependent oxidoreductase [Frankia nepalensis]MBL7524266.1 LLM class flavin-dependent oxidoreductase [Frankia nepalensis]MBL7629248.1 LLM class flavin-dependent oxidoreductase [Frankia nepalensis]